MAGPSQLVKGIDDGIGVRGSQVDVDCGAVDGAVTKSGFKGQEVKAVLVAVGSVGMAERMSAEAGIHAKCFPALKDDSLEPLLIHGFAGIGLLGKKPCFRLQMVRAGIPIMPDVLAYTLGNGYKAVRVVFGNRDIKAMRRKEDIATFQMAEFV